MALELLCIFRCVTAKEMIELATEFSVTPGSVFDGCVGLSVSVVECLQESASISIRQTSDLDILEYLSSFSNDGRDCELRDRLAQILSRVLNDSLEFARKSDIDPCIAPGSGCHAHAAFRSNDCTSPPTYDRTSILSRVKVMTSSGA